MRLGDSGDEQSYDAPSPSFSVARNPLLQRIPLFHGVVTRPDGRYVGVLDTLGSQLHGDSALKFTLLCEVAEAVGGPLRYAFRSALLGSFTAPSHSLDC